MKLWGYYAFHTFINSIKKMFRSTFLVILVLIVFVFGIFGAAIGLFANYLEDELTQDMPEGGNREGYGDPEYGLYNEKGEFLFYDDLYDEGLGGYDENGAFIYYEDALEQGLGYYDESGEFVFYYEELTEEDMTYLMQVVETIAALVVLLILIFGARSGLKQGGDIFMMADVNFLFTAPIKPQSVLLFRLTFQMLAVFAATLYLLFQIPNLVLNVGVSLVTCFAIYFALILAFIVQKVVSVGTYTYVATHEKWKKFLMPSVYAMGILLVGATVLVFYVSGDIWETFACTWAAPWSRLVPFVGWIKAIVYHTVYGNMGVAAWYFLLTLAGMLVLVYLVWKMKADFYEDAMTKAQAREDITLAMQENRKTVEVDLKDGKKKEKRKVSSELTPILERAKGVQVFLAKELLVRKRLAKFGVVTNTMLWYMAISLAFSCLNVFVLETNNFMLIGFSIMLILYFRNYGNPIAGETSMNWIFLVPESPYKKVFYSMLAGTCATVLDLLPAFVVAIIMMDVNPVELLLWYVVLITMDFMLSGVGLVLEAIFPASAMDVVKSSLQLIFKLVMMILIIAAIVIGMAIMGLEFGLLLNLGLNLLFGAVSFVIYPSLLHEGIS